MRKKIIFLVSCGLVLIVLGVVYFLTQNRAAENGEETPTSTPQPQLAEGDAEAISVLSLSSGERTITFKKDGENWVCGDYPDAALNQANINTTARYAANLSAVATITDSAENLADYGLTAERCVTAEFSDGSENVVLVGNLTPDGERYYVTVPNSKAVYAVSSYVGGLLTRGYADFLQASVPEFDLTGLRELDFYNGGAEMYAVYNPERDENGTTYRASDLVLETPIPGKAVYLENFQSFVLDKLAEIDFSNAVDENGQRAAVMASPRLRLEMNGASFDEEGNENGEFKYFLAIGGAVPDEPDYSYAVIGKGSSPCVYKLKNTEIAALFTANPYKMMDKFVYIIYINNLEKIVIDSAEKGTFDCEINGYKDYSTSEEGFDEIAPTINGEAVVVEAFRKFYQLLIGMSVDSAIENFKPAGEPELTITYAAVDGKTATARYFAYDDNFLAIEQDGRVDFVISRAYVGKTLLALTQVAGGAEKISVD